MLYEQLNQMRERPGMYLGRKSLTLLGAYIAGYVDHQYAIDKNHRSSFSKFGEYVREYFDIHTDHDWIKIITFYSSTDEDAVDLFYTLLDRFLNNQLPTT
jgi:hypothetical protein